MTGGQCRNREIEIRTGEVSSTRPKTESSLCNLNHEDVKTTEYVLGISRARPRPALSEAAIGSAN